MAPAGRSTRRPARATAPRRTKAPAAARSRAGHARLFHRLVRGLDEPVREDLLERGLGLELPVLDDGVARVLHLLRIEDPDAFGLGGLVPHPFEERIDRRADVLLVGLGVEL